MQYMGKNTYCPTAVAGRSSHSNLSTPQEHKTRNFAVTGVTGIGIIELLPKPL